MHKVRVIFTDAGIVGTYMDVTDAQLAFLGTCDRLNIADGSGDWHSADIVRRIFDPSDGLITLVVAD